MDSWLIKLDANLIRTIVIQGATFLAFFMVVKVFFADKIKAMLEERKEAIAKDLSAATEAKENAEKLENEYADILKGANEEKASIIRSATEDGEQMKEKIVAEVPLCNDPITKGHEPECPTIWRGELLISMNPGVYSIGYVALDEPTTKDGVTYIECSLCGHNLKTLSHTETVLGDADGDGHVDAYDASQVMKYSVGSITADELNISNLDVDGDGHVDAYDAALIQKRSVGVIDKFPAET